MPWFSITRWSWRLTPRPLMFIVAPAAITVVPSPPAGSGAAHTEVQLRVDCVAAPYVVDTQSRRVVTVNRAVP